MSATACYYEAQDCILCCQTVKKNITIENSNRIKPNTSCTKNQDQNEMEN